MSRFKVGQRWISESEPELGLGVIVEVESKILTCFFPASKVDRRYGLNTAPLRRITFSIGDEIRTQKGEVFLLESISEKDGLYFYEGGGVSISETSLADTLTFSKPEERLFAGNIDSNELFKLRYDVLLNQRKNYLSPARGFLGPKVSIIPHQMYVAQEIVKRSRPRVLLADEVGLGKTIEAGLILHHLIQTGRAERVLILVPDSLVYQWFVEMLRKFQLTFRTINHDSQLSKGDRPFEESQLFIASLKYVIKEDWLMDQVIESDWDLLIVDEAHQMKWSPENSSIEYDFVATLSKQIAGLLLLSGTPEILGLAGHFSRLQLLDPNRFHDYEKFINETTEYQEISHLADKLLKKSELGIKDKKLLLEKYQIDSTNLKPQECLQMLVDRHGTGRVYFRNTRKTMALFQEFFPKRVLHSAPLKMGKSKNIDKTKFETKIKWLADLINSKKGEKILLICHDKDLVLELEKKLKELTISKIAFFHSGMNLMNRDRQAAFFADPEGADVLLSTEIGSEGRNFEFAKHLVLYDIPKLPDLLEQRIGRLDRIGQKNDIQIHVPYFENTSEEILFKWFHEGLNAFESSPKGATELFATLRAQLVHFMELSDSQELDQVKWQDFLKETKSIHQEIENRLEEGQDRLIELNSFNFEKAEGFVKEIKQVDDSSDLKDFMLNLFNQLGVDVDDMDDPDTFFIRPGDNMYMPHFPGLPNEGLLISFNRSKALKREDMTFLTWDHPMVLGIMDFISSKEIGNSTIVSWKTPSKESFLFEGFYLLSSVADKKLQIEKWFPPTPLRVLINAKLEDLTGKFPKKIMDDSTSSLDQEKRNKLPEIPKDFLKNCVKKGKELCLARAKQYKDKFIEDMTKSFDSEISRLQSLREVNPTVSETEIVLLKFQKNELLKSMQNAELSLDSLRIILN